MKRVFHVNGESEVDWTELFAETPERDQNINPAQFSSKFPQNIVTWNRKYLHNAKRMLEKSKAKVLTVTGGIDEVCL